MEPGRRFFGLGLVLLAALAGCTSSPVVDSPPRSVAIVPERAARPLIALVLGSGGSRGFAHVGVIKALEREGVRADIVVGTSSGALVAALHAAGNDAAALERLALDLEESDLIDATLTLSGFRVRGELLARFVNLRVGQRRIEQLDRPFAVVATVAKGGAAVIFNRGDTGAAVRASASVPGLFLPVSIDGVEYVDGGLSRPVPAGVARSMGAAVVIAVDITRFSPTGERAKLLADDLRSADVVIRPLTRRTRTLDFAGKHAAIAAGEAAAKDAMPAILARLLAAGVVLAAPAGL